SYISFSQQNDLLNEALGSTLIELKNKKRNPDNSSFDKELNNTVKHRYFEACFKYFQSIEMFTLKSHEQYSSIFLEETGKLDYPAKKVFLLSYIDRLDMEIIQFYTNLDKETINQYLWNGYLKLAGSISHLLKLFPMSQDTFLIFNNYFSNNMSNAEEEDFIKFLNEEQVNIFYTQVILRYGLNTGDILEKLNNNYKNVIAPHIQ
ncbi:MAG: hypothetical protein ABI921_05730, partial [Panacibacter sp.]